MQVFVAVAISAICAFAPQSAGRAASSMQRAATAKRVSLLLEEAAFKYRKAKDGLWVVTFRGDRVPSVDVAVQAQEEMIIVLATVQRKTSPSPAQLRQLLEANYEANYSKLAIDDDGDLLALTELPVDLSVAAFKAAVDEVATLADTAAGLVGSVSAESGPASPSGARGAAAEETLEVVPAGKGAALSLLRGAFEVSYDPKKWQVEKTDEPGVTQLNHTSGDAYVRVISERLQVAPESLRGVALTNAKQAAPDFDVDSETWQTTNGLRVLVLRYSGTAQGVKLTFFNQMFSDMAGTVQLAGWTGTSLFDEYRRDFLELFAGLRRLR